MKQEQTIIQQPSINRLFNKFQLAIEFFDKKHDLTPTIKRDLLAFQKAFYNIYSKQIVLQSNIKNKCLGFQVIIYPTSKS